MAREIVRFTRPDTHCVSRRRHFAICRSARLEEVFLRFTSKPIAESNEAPIADDGRLESVVERFERRNAPAKPPDARGNACHVVSVSLRGEGADPDNKLREIVGLVRAQGDRVVGQEIVRLTQLDPRTYLGRGTSAAVAERALEQGADMLVLDAELSPSQLRNLEDAAGMPICDREAVILNVFQAHATTRRARIQVEVAHLEYLRPRIRGLGLEMDQQAGGMMKARGPGETASELLARRLDGRLADLRRALDKLAAAGAEQRRRRADCARIVLVGYTNAGKTSLMNALTEAGLSARDSLFETLDTTSRSLHEAAALPRARRPWRLRPHGLALAAELVGLHARLAPTYWPVLACVHPQGVARPPSGSRE